MMNARAPTATPTPMPAFAPVLRPGTSVPGCDGVSRRTESVDRTTPIFFANEVAYSEGNDLKSSIWNATTIGSAIARPVDSMVVLLIFVVDQVLAEVTYVEVVNSYVEEIEAPETDDVMSRARACRGVENVLIHASRNSGPNVIPLATSQQRPNID